MPMSARTIDHPAALRNRQPIFDQLVPQLIGPTQLLEIASGNGTHATFFCRQLPQLTWQPSEVDTDKLSALAVRVAQEGLTNLKAPIALDATNQPWPVVGVDVVLAINLVHIAPIAVLQGLLAGASQALTSSGLLALYGPYKIEGQHTSIGNRDFDKQLRNQNPAIGIRDLTDVMAAAQPAGFSLQQRMAMPANNQLLILTR